MNRKWVLSCHCFLAAIIFSLNAEVSRAEQVSGDYCFQQVVRVLWGGLVPAIPGLRGLRPGEMVQVAQFVNLTDREVELRLRLRYRGNYAVLGSVIREEGAETKQVDEEVTGIVRLQPREEAQQYPIHLRNIFFPAPEPGTAMGWGTHQDFQPEIIYPKTSCYLETAASRSSDSSGRQASEEREVTGRAPSVSEPPPTISAGMIPPILQQHSPGGPDQSNTRLQLDTGFKAYKSGDYTSALKVFQPLAAQGNSVAQAQLGKMFYRGEGVPQSDLKAFELLKMAADQGNHFAECGVASMIDQGKGNSIDKLEKIKWILRAAQGGSSLCQHMAGDLYFQGDGVTRDLAQALAWYQKAGDQGDEKAKEVATRLQSLNQSSGDIVGQDGAPMRLIGAGEFLYGNERKSLPSFYLDVYEVTTKLYEHFRQSTDRTGPPDWALQLSLIRRGDRPVVNVALKDAEAYCAHYGKRLPTDEEWEKAARGAEGRNFPWGDERPQRKYALYGVAWDGYMTLAVVGTHLAGVSPYGIHDLVGNVSEWTTSDSRFGEGKIVRGGSWKQNIFMLQRDAFKSTTRATDIGFRCAQDAAK